MKHGLQRDPFPVVKLPPYQFQLWEAAHQSGSGCDYVSEKLLGESQSESGQLDVRGRRYDALVVMEAKTVEPATARALDKYALRIAAIPSEYRAEAIVPAIGGRRIRGASILIPRAQVAREILPKILLERGARAVEVAPAYRTVRPAARQTARVRAMASAGEIDLVTFTSSSTVENFCELVGDAARGLSAAAIGPITAATAAKHGLKVAVEPAEYTTDALIGAIRAYYEDRDKRRASAV